MTWLKFQVNFKQRHEKPSILLERLQKIEHQLRHHRHPSNRQQYQENKHQMKSIADDLHLIGMQLQGKLIGHAQQELPACITPLSAGSSGYGSDLS